MENEKINFFLYQLKVEFSELFFSSGGLGRNMNFFYEFLLLQKKKLILMST